MPLKGVSNSVTRCRGASAILVSRRSPPWRSHTFNRGSTARCRFPRSHRQQCDDSATLLTDLTGSVETINQSFGIMNSKNLTLTSSPVMPYKFYQQHQRELSAFFKDDWKIRPDLTLNLGVHWEYYGQPWKRVVWMRGWSAMMRVP